MDESLEEAKEQMLLMMPTALVYASSVLQWLVSFAVLGRLGEKQLAGASLGMTLSNLFGNVVTLGLSSALDIHLTQVCSVHPAPAERIGLLTDDRA